MDVTQILLNSLAEPYIVLSKDLICLSVNRAFAELVEGTVGDLSGSAVTNFWPNAKHACGFSGEHTVEFHLPAGKVITARVAIKVSELVVVRVLSSVAQGETAQLHHQQRLESLGLLAGGIAHDFNNVLTGILGHVAYLKHTMGAGHAAHESLGAIEEGVVRASGLTQQILRFSKLDSTDQSSQVDVPDLIGRVVTLLKSAIPSEVALRVHPTRESFRVLASEAHMTQIAINLIMNARDAIAKGGAIDVSLVPRCSAEEVRRLFGTEPAASLYGAMVVSDNGVGMDEQVKARLFEPYFTTKSSSGTGLGLATVHSIVEQLGGAIDVQSEPGKGSTFRIVLPVLSEQDAPAATQSGEAGDLKRGSGQRVLVIDDEYAVRNVLGLSLSHLGYQVDTAGSGAEGLEKFESAQEPYQLVILDLLMPGLSGEEVFTRLRALNARVPILIVSGFSSEHVVQRILQDGAEDFIQKPFSIETLAGKVQGCFRD